MDFIIKEVIPGSIANKNGLIPGDVVSCINGEKLIDSIDLEYLLATENPVLTITSKDYINSKDILVKKKEWEDIGIIFESSSESKTARCCNKCLFCFVDQLPDGMRSTLYFKDDDWRMSFVMGSYITLTNIGKEEFERIKKRKVSPLYISVHATDDDIRSKLLGTKRGAGIIGKMKELTDAGIVCHTQVVLCPGINDSHVLEKTIDDMSSLYPGVRSLAVVPVGLTEHRNGLHDIHPVDLKCASETLGIVHNKARELYDRIGTRFVYASDEMYIKAETEIPDYEEYEDFPQIENGVGLIAQFLDDAACAIDEYESSILTDIDMVTGRDFYPYLYRIANMLINKYNINVTVHSVENHFFGNSVTVAGLLTGQDIVEQLKGKIKSDTLLLPPTMFREFSDVTLDNMTLSDLEKSIGARCIVSGADGYSLVKTVCEGY